MRWTLALAALLILPLTASAQQPALSLDVSVTARFEDDATAALHREAIGYLEDALRVRGMRLSETPALVFLVGVRALDGRDEIAVSVVTLHSMPEALIEKGRQDEVFYLNVPAEERATFPPEGKWVREDMSEAFLRQFLMIQQHDLAVVPRAELRQTLIGLAEAFVERQQRLGRP